MDRPDCGNSARADAYKSVIVKDNMLYTLSNGTVMTSADGTAWTAVAAADIRQLLGAGTSKMYAMDAAGRPVSSADTVPHGQPTHCRRRGKAARAHAGLATSRLTQTKAQSA